MSADKPPTFSMTVRYRTQTSAPRKVTDLANLTTLDPSVGFWIEAMPPTSGYVVPALGASVKLAGGAPGTRASGLIYSA